MEQAADPVLGRELVISAHGRPGRQHVRRNAPALQELQGLRADLERFEHGIGKLTVDLRTTGLELDDRTVEASLGIGDLLVLVPADTDVKVDAHVGIGNIQALGREENGIDADLERISGTAGAQEVELELEVGIGSIRVELED